MNDGPAVDLNEQVLAEPNAAAIELRRQLASANGSMVPGKLKVDYSAWATSGWSAAKPPSGILGVTDTFVLTSGNNSNAGLADPPITSNKHGLLLAEPIVLPAMGHLAAKPQLPIRSANRPVTAPTTAPSTTNERLFYPSGTKSLALRSCVADALKDVSKVRDDPAAWSGDLSTPAGRRAVRLAGQTGSRGPYGKPRPASSKTQQQRPSTSSSGASPKERSSPFIDVFAHRMEQQLRDNRTRKTAAYTGIQANDPPRRTSIVNRPGTAASTASAMRERGTRLRVLDQKQLGRPRTSSSTAGAAGGTSPLSPTSAFNAETTGAEPATTFDDKKGSNSSRSSSSSSSRAETQTSVDTFELKHSLRAANGGLAIAMKQSQSGGLKGSR